MKQLVLITIGVLFIGSMYAQNQDWEVTYGFPGHIDYANDIIEDYDNGYYVVSGSDYYSLKIKTSTNGSLLHDNIIAHDEGDISTWAVARDNIGNIFVGGPMFYDDTYPWVAKFDSCGEKVWCRHFPNTECDYGGGVWDMLINTNNELIVLMHYSCADEGDQIYLAGLDENGNELWKKPYATKKDYPLIVNPIGYDLMELNGGYYIAGDCYWPYPGNPNHVYLRPLFIGIDSYFKEKWMLPFYALDSVFGEARALLPLNDTVILGIGSRWSDGYNMNTLIMAFNDKGEELAYFQIPNEAIGTNIDFNAVREFEKLNDSLFISPVYLGVEGEQHFGEIVYDIRGILHNNSIRDIYKYSTVFTKTNTNDFVIAASVEGNPSGSDIYLYKIDENLQSVPFDTTQHVYDSLCPHTIQSGTINLTDCLIVTDIGELPGPAEYYESLRWISINAYPNPVREGKVTLEFENTKHHQNMEICCYNNFGREIHRQKIYKGQQDTDVNVSAWGKGVYIAVIYSNGGAVGKVKFVVEGGRR